MSSPAKSTTAAAARSIIYLGMDVHKESITIAVLPEVAKSPTRLDRLPNNLPKLKKWLERVSRDGEIRACYEASGAGSCSQQPQMSEQRVSDIPHVKSIRSIGWRPQQRRVCTHFDRGDRAGRSMFCFGRRGEARQQAR